MALLSPEDRQEAIFGGFDGLTSALGLVVGLALTTGLKALAVGATALAVGAAVSMAGGESLSDERSEGNMRRALAMGVATFVGSFLPAVPFFVFSGLAAWLTCGAISAALAALIAEARPGRRLPSYCRTFALLGIAAAAAVGASVLAGAAA